MNPVYVEPEPDDFSVGVAAFLSSLGWTYLTHRYSPEVQGVLLGLLTLSGLDSWCWERYAMQLANYRRTDSVVLHTLTPKQNDDGPVELRVAVEEIWTYADSEGASVVKPPHCPGYLAAYGYTSEMYVADLRAVYDDEIEDHYLVPWPDTPYQLQEMVIQPVLLREAVAIMGATAGAIEQLIAIGGGNDHRD